MDKFNALMNALGASIDDDMDTILDKITPYLSKQLTEQMPPKESGCIWEIKYFNSGESVRLFKMRGDEVRGTITVALDGVNAGTSELSNPDDEDLKACRDMFVRVFLSDL